MLIPIFPTPSTEESALSHRLPSAPLLSLIDPTRGLISGLCSVPFICVSAFSVSGILPLSLQPCGVIENKEV